MNLSARNIRRYVGAASFERGSNYLTAGSVLSCSVEDDSVHGKVSGSEEAPYDTKFEVDKGEIINSSCSCPLGGVCKHVAALGLKFLVQKPQPQSRWMNALSELIENKPINPEEIFNLQIVLTLERDASEVFLSILFG